MNYLWLGLVLIAVILVRIDYLLVLIDRLQQRVDQSQSVEIAADIKKNQLIPIEQDQNLKNSPRRMVLALLDEFLVTPTPALRKMLLEKINQHSNMFGVMVDPALEGKLIGLRDRIQQRNTESIILLADLLRSLSGENQLMIRKYFSLVMDHDLNLFFAHYPFQLDIECQVAGMTADALPPEEIVNELTIRARSIFKYLSQEKPEAQLRSFAQACLQVIRSKVVDRAATENVGDQL
jgi:hypothetical protein